MANSLVVRKGTELAKRIKALRAAQYVRMSTDYQRYSIENQAAAIAVYAQQRHFTIVRTYRDEGRSGLKIKGRAGLIELIDDIQSGRADFDHVLVYDVSRWGRFQDVDESAYYEFICKQNGIRVAYCAEVFENDGSLLSSIVKNIKRVMAAEFSRELSAKVVAAKLHGASLGFRQGGPLSFGVRRELLDEHQRSKGYLECGQEKNVKTDRVVLRLGPADEVGVVQHIFRQYVECRQSFEMIARGLNHDSVPNHCGRPWTSTMVKSILQNENFIGNTVYNHESSHLRGKVIKNPPDLWIRNKGVMPPAVDGIVFRKAQRRATLRWRHLTDDEMLSRLTNLLRREGRLSQPLMIKTLGIPCVDVYRKRFGSMLNVYKLIGYESDFDCDWIERSAEFKLLITKFAADIVYGLGKAGFSATFEPNRDVLTIAERTTLSLRLARSSHRSDRKLFWTINRRVVFPKGYVVAVRLGEGNDSVIDYFLLPTKAITKRSIRFMESGLSRFDGCRFQTTGTLIKAILRLIHRRSPAVHQSQLAAGLPSRRESSRRKLT